MKIKIELKKKETDFLNYPYYEVIIYLKVKFLGFWYWKKFTTYKSLVTYLLKHNFSEDIMYDSFMFHTGIATLVKMIDKDIGLHLTTEGMWYEGSFVLLTTKYDENGSYKRGEEYLTKDIEKIPEYSLEEHTTELVRKLISCILGNIPIVNISREDEDMKMYTRMNWKLNFKCR